MSNAWYMVGVGFVSGMSAGISLASLVMREAAHKAERRRTALRLAEMRARPVEANVYSGIAAGAITDLVLPEIQRAIDEGRIVCRP